MTVDIEAIARSERCDASSLRIALPLLEQGYLPPFLARYRRDELGGIGEAPLWSLLDAIRTEQRLQERREELLQRCRESGVADEAFQRVIHDARSQRALDRIARRLRHEPSDPAQQLAARVLSPHRDDPADPAALAERTVGAEATEAATTGLERALTSRLTNDPRLTRAAVRWLGKHAKLRILEVADPHVEENDGGAADQQQSGKKSASKRTKTPSAEAKEKSAEPTAMKPEEPAASDGEATAAGGTPAGETAESHPAADTETKSDAAASLPPAPEESTSGQAGEEETGKEEGKASATSPEAGDGSSAKPAAEADAAPGSEQAAGGEGSAPVTDQSSAPTEQSSAPTEQPSTSDAALKGEAESGNGKKGEPPASPKKKKISPRQRRRRWLVSVLQPLKGKTLTPSKLTAFQTVMLGRALRSEVVQCAFQYDAGELLQHLQKTAEGFHPSRADQLRKIIAENEAKIREAAEAAWWDELVDGAAVRLVRVAADQFRRQMLREPIDARVILSIDALGPKTAAVAIVAADGRLLHTEDVPCQLSAAMRQQTVTRLGELVHQFHVDLIVVSNGPARRASLVVLSELLEQSQPGSLRWTMAERSGADLYANGPAGNREMRSTPRRFRAATWLGFQAIAPTQALIKVEPTKLRLGSFQRELADDALAEALGDVLVSGVSNDGVDTNGADQSWLARLPGMSESVADAIHRRRRKNLFISRSEVNELAEWPGDVARNQAIGFLRVFQSEQTLDGTLIHPDDYALAEKLAKSLEIPLPPAAPPGYEPPSFDQSDKSGDAEQAENSGAEGPTSADESAVAEASAAVTEDASAAAGSEAAGTAEGEAAPSEVSTGSTEEAPAQEASAADEAAASSEEPASQTDAAPPAEAAITPGETPAAGDQATEEASDQETVASDKAATDDADAARDVTELKSFREPAANIDTEAEEKPAPPSVPEPYRHPRPEKDKIARLAKEWQIGPYRAQQIVNWLCDPFTSGSSPVIAAPAAVMQRVPKLAELKPGERVSGVVVGVAPFGVFVELGPDCNGLIHVSRLSETYVEDLHEAVQVGDVVVAWVTGVDTKRRRVALSAVSPEREAELAEQRKQRRGDGRRGGARSEGQRSGQRGPAGGGRGPGAGGRGPAGGRRREQQGRDRGRDSKRSDQGPRTYTKVSKTKAAPPPITEAMQKGDEPLRTFGDLMQFFQQGKEEKKAAKPKAESPKAEIPEKSKSSEADSSTPDTPSSVNPAKQGDASETPPPLPTEGAKETDAPASDAVVEASRENESSQNR